MKIDLQVHTTLGSPDSQIDPLALPHLCRDRGLDGVALTEHRQSSFQQIGQLLASEGLLLIPAREVSCGGAHLLVLCEDEHLLETLTPLVSPEHPTLAREDVAVIWAHPAAPSGSSAYAPSIRRDPAIEAILSGVEVLNGRHLHFPEAVEGAESLASQTHLAATAGSDAHTDQDLGRCFTEIDCGLSEGASGAIKAIRSG
ncbi:MAG TPA: PHP-associated domain-containing protein, partial [Actinomycetota bacterium]|nr:PHP-associated domain-containing protein [Actinomycetota bacterium]